MKPGKQKSATPKKKPKKPSPVKFYPGFVLIAILILTVIAYSNIFNNEILNFDDNEYFANYPEIVQFKMSHIITYFSNYYVLMYQPLPILSFALTYKFFALQPAAYHALNLIFHLFNILCVYFFVKKISTKETALIAGLLFAVHPMNVEAVTWISARSSSMFVFFYLLSLIFYLNYLKQSYKIKYVLFSLLFFVLSLLSKAHAVTLPLVLFTIDYLYKRKFDKRFIIEKIPFLLQSLVFGIIAISDKSTTGNILMGLEKYTFFDNIFLLAYSVSFYMIRFFVPINLCSVYVYPEKINNLLPWEFYAAPIFLLIIIFLILKYRKTYPLILFGSLFFILSISLTLQIIPSRLFIVADRYSYLPYLGFFIICGEWYSRIDKKTLRNFFKILIVFAGIVFSVFSWQRNKVWANDLTLSSDIISKNPEVPYIARAFGVRANFYLNRLKNYDKAMENYNIALKLDTTDAISFYNRGYLHDMLSNYKGVIADMSRAAQLGIENHLLYNFLGAAYYHEQNISKSIECFEKAVQLNPGYIESYNNLGAIYGSIMDIDKANFYTDKALAMQPNNTESLRNKGIIYFKQSNYNEACRYWQMAKTHGAKNVDDLINLYCN